MTYIPLTSDLFT